MRALLGCGLAVVLAVVAGANADAQDDKKIDEKKLVGKWEPKEGKKDAKVVIEFTKDGKLSVVAEGGGKEFKIDGTYKVDGNKLTMTMKFMDQEMKETVTVTKLTDTEMEGEDSKGKKEAFTRVKDTTDKKDKKDKK